MRHMAPNETIFVTGFPGFLATRLVKRLAGEGARFILLTQPAFVTAAREAVQQIVHCDHLNRRRCPRCEEK